MVTQRIQRARLSLEGLSVGDALGEQYFDFPEWIPQRKLPAPRWRYTDDTEMALAIVEVLDRHARIDQDDLAQTFAVRYRNDPQRGYGATAHEILAAINEGVCWRDAAGDAFGGEGSMGNGSAMRVAPLGAYFADDLEAVVREARASAQVTHMHPEGEAGAIAVAVAAAAAWQVRASPPAEAGRRLLEMVIEQTPASDTVDGIRNAIHLAPDAGVDEAVAVLGNGSRITAPDTVPFTLWCAAKHLDDYAEALWTTVSGLGDRDTTCAIVGGIVSLSARRDSIPEEWLLAREPLPPIGS